MLSQSEAARFTAGYLATEVGVEDMATALLRAARNHVRPATGEFNPTALVVSAVTVSQFVPFRALAWSAQAREAWLAEVREMARLTQAFMTVTLVKSRFRWAGQGDRHEVLVAAVDHSTLGARQWVAQVEWSAGVATLGEPLSLGDVARATVPGFSGGARATGALAHYARLLPVHFAN